MAKSLYKMRVLVLCMALLGVEGSIRSTYNQMGSSNLSPTTTTTTTTPTTTPTTIRTTTTTTISPLLSALIEAMKNMPMPEDPIRRQRFDERQRSSELNVCMRANTSDTLRGLQGVAKVRKFSTTFFMRPRTSFQKLEFTMRLALSLDPSNNFYSDESLKVGSSEIGPLEEWKEVSVEYYEHPVRGPNKHALRMIVGNTNISLVSGYRWLFYEYAGFAIHAVGGAEFLFNCQPEVLGSTGLGAQGRSAGVWLMVGLLVVATLLLALLLTAWLTLRCKNKKKLGGSAHEYPVYDEFDEEVLKNLRKKVEVLRGSKSDVCVVTNDAENPYVKQKVGTQEEDSEDHIYDCPYALIQALQKEPNVKDDYYEDPYALIESWNNRAEIEENIYDCPYALIEAHKNMNEQEGFEGPHATVGLWQKKSDPNHFEDAHATPLGPYQTKNDQNDFEDAYPAVGPWQKKSNHKKCEVVYAKVGPRKKDAKTAEKHYQNLYSTRPYISANK